jgi:diacylglycerol kinase (ATP)
MAWGIESPPAVESDGHDTIGAMAGRFSLRARAQSFRYAGRGAAVVLGQHNARIHAAATVLALALAAGLRIPHGDWLWILAAITWVWGAEALNTALEHLADAVHPDEHPGIARAKDAAAAGVLFAAAGAALIGLLVLGPPLWGALGR